ncbi:MAG TPA: cellulose biosynthesis protein BcsS [Xanthobacteraceae bacterium]|nr:cellulose biosynthesis protein BcsS [Xanthobacteraceae bacterium]
MWRSTGLPLAAVVGLAASASAVAADLPVFVKAQPVVSAAPWTGFYAGAHFGYGWGDKTFIDNFPTPDGELDAAATVRGWLGGLQGGYNHQFNWLVVGVEGDFTWSGVTNSFSCFPFGDQVCSAKPEWLGSVAGRLGVAQGPALFYVKGGAAWAHDRFTDVATCSGHQPTSRAGITAACGDMFIGNQTRPGWLFAVGIEYLFAPNWSAKLEYDHMDFGSQSVPFIDGGNGFFTEEIHQRVDVVKLGLNYHFNWGAAAVPVGGAGYVKAAPKDDDDAGRVLAFSAFDVSKYSYSGLVGTLIAPFKDLDTSGLRFWLFGEGGVYKYPAGGEFIRGTFESGDVLAGYAFEGDFYSVNLLAGFNASNHVLSNVDPENKVQGTAFGAKVRADAWVNPTPKTLTYGEAEYSTAFRTYFAKTKFGYDFTDGKEIFFGPEFAALGDERFNQWRVGAHLTQMKFGKVQVDVSAGYANDSVVGTGAYGTVEVSTHF